MRGGHVLLRVVLMVAVTYAATSARRAAYVRPNAM